MGNQETAHKENPTSKQNEKLNELIKKVESETTREEEEKDAMCLVIEEL